MTETQPPEGTSVPALLLTAEDLSDVVKSLASVVARKLRDGHLRLPAGTTQASLVEDIAGDAVLTACEKADGFDPSRSVRAWVMGFALKKLLSYYRDESRSKVNPVRDVVRHDPEGGLTDEDLFGLLETSDPEAVVHARLDAERALLLLTTLDGNGASNPTNAAHADLLRSRYLSGDSVEEIAHRLGVSTDSVHKKLSLARAAARRALGVE